MSENKDTADATKRIAERIDALQRKDDKAYSFAAIGKRVRVSRETVRQWYEGESFPRRGNLSELAADIGLTVEHILFGTEAEEAPPNMIRGYLTPQEAVIIQMIRELGETALIQTETLLKFLREQQPAANVAALPGRRQPPPR